ncbi:type II toxin-antitoxin system MqsA family antitoxin [Candidatus Leptofilum sp.]|uniref:type II toxin-antitoxin system MqsA family antitoxin n=1 Tax=Candidatus Leptofilum sp. TaxID=3241576 RepID=UPI003B5BE531
MQCSVCKGVMLQETTTYKTEINGEEVMIEDVPVWVCEQCDSSFLDDDVIEAIEDMLSSLAGGLANEEPPEEIELE